jgi:hypothetical protein
MKKSVTFLAAASLFCALSSAQILRPLPPNSTTNARAVGNLVIPAPDLSQYAPIDSVGRGTPAWSTYFPNTSKILNGNSSQFMSINANGYVVTQYGSTISVGNFPVTFAGFYVAFVCNQPTTVATTFTATPVFTDAAKRTGGAPYDWTASGGGPSVINERCL